MSQVQDKGAIVTGGASGIGGIALVTIRLSGPWSERRSAADLMKPPSGHLLKGSHLPEEFLSRLSRAAEQYGARGGI